MFSGATWNGTVWTGGSWSTKSYGYQIYLRGAAVSGPLVLIQDDGGSKLTGYGYATGTLPITNAYEWVQRASNAPVNILTRDDATFVTTRGTFPASGTNCSAALTAETYALDGANVLMLTNTSGSTNDISIESGLYPVAPSTQYTGVGAVYPVSATNNATLSINWYDSTSTFISTAVGATLAENTGSWLPLTVTASSPTNAAFATVMPTVTATASSEKHACDCFGLFQGTNSLWSYPGIGIGSSRTLTYTGSQLTSIA